MLNVNVEVGLIIKKIVNIMKKIKLYIELYYPVILSFLSFLYSVSLWFSGYQLEGIFVGIWVPSILALSISIRQRRNDFFRQQAYKNRRKGNYRKKRK
jgi:hypothetical protein